MRLSDFVTDASGKGDATRLLVLMGAAGLLAYSGVNVLILRQPFHSAEFGEGFGWFLAGAGAHAFGTSQSLKGTPPQ